VWEALGKLLALMVSQGLNKCWLSSPDNGARSLKRGVVLIWCSTQIPHVDQMVAESSL
jgi:hypothetical protein